MTRDVIVDRGPISFQWTLFNGYLRFKKCMSRETQIRILSQIRTQIQYNTRHIKLIINIQ